ncbi:hypothetical protein F5Y04DRAFT_292977 [Hypomontagnella monticulosa]|nr:hypothetical protein F5Y04DRAFT_292977 [Hypomontagnella monticulosa]
MAPSVPFSIEGVHQGLPKEPILYRIRVPTHGTGESHPSQIIKYLTAPSPPEGVRGIPDYRGKLLGFDTVPVGDWNLGRLVIPSHGAEKKFVLIWTEQVDLEEAVGLLDARPPWRDRNFDLVDLLDALDARRKSDPTNSDQNDPRRVVTDIQCMNHVSAAILPTPDGTGIDIADLGPDVIGIWAWQPGHAHGIGNAIRIYSIIQGHDPRLAPWFIGHITDNGTRVIGYLIERAKGAREAGPADLKICRTALERLHHMGIAYGASLKRHSFLVGNDGMLAVLQGFGGAFETRDKEVLRREMESLEEVLAQNPSELEKANAPRDVRLNAKSPEFHPQLANKAYVASTNEQRRELAVEPEVDDYRWTTEDMEKARICFKGAKGAKDASGNTHDEPTG